jgi:hypothetical protein
MRRMTIRSIAGALACGHQAWLGIFQWIAQRGWLPSNTELRQVCYGAEIVSTGNVPETFSYSNYSVNAS